MPKSKTLEAALQDTNVSAYLERWVDNQISEQEQLLAACQSGRRCFRVGILHEGRWLEEVGSSWHGGEEEGWGVVRAWEQVEGEERESWEEAASYSIVESTNRGEKDLW